jgi:fructose 1,6-bisphosphatase
VCKPEGILAYCGSEFQVQAAEVTGEETEAIAGQPWRTFRRTAAINQQLRMILRARRVEVKDEL